MNEEIIKVLIGNDSVEYVDVAARLRNSAAGIYAYTRKKDGKIIYDTILKDAPDIVVCDLSLPNLDSLSLMQKVKSHVELHTEFIIISEIANGFFERQAFQNGASCFMSPPITCDMLCSVIKSIARKKINEYCLDIELVVTDILLSLGVPPHVKGYQYLRTAILKTTQNYAFLEKITKNLYPEIAEIYSTTPSRVERAIRNAIEIAWERCSSEKAEAFFGYKVDRYHGRPTNSEFIAFISDKLNLRMKNAATKSKKNLNFNDFSCENTLIGNNL